MHPNIVKFLYGNADLSLASDYTLSTLKRQVGNLISQMRDSINVQGYKPNSIFEETYTDDEITIECCKQYSDYESLDKLFSDIRTEQKNRKNSTMRV